MRKLKTAPTWQSKVMEYLKHRRSGVLLAADLSVVFAASLLAYLLGLSVRHVDIRTSNFTDFGIYALFAMLVYAIIMRIAKIHRSLWTFISAKELLVLGLVVVVGAILNTIPAYILVSDKVSLLVFSVLSAGLVMAGMSAIRVIYRSYREELFFQKNNPTRQRALIIGADESGYVLLKELQHNTKINAEVIGFIDSKHVGHAISGIPVLGGYDDIDDLVMTYNIAIVYIARPALTHQQITDLVNRLGATDVRMKVMRFYDKNDDEASVPSHRIEDVSLEDLLERGQITLDQEEVSSYIQGKNILVTGAGGSIGGQLVREILKFKPAHIYMLDINENGLYLLERELESDAQLSGVGITSLIVNIREKETLEEVFSRYNIDVVFHAAAHKHVPLMEERPQEAVKNNVFGTKNVLDYAIKYKADRFIMISTDKAVNPTNVMGASKRATELILQSHSGKSSSATKLASVRFGNVLGSNGSVIPIFKSQIEKGGPITVTDKRIERYFMTIPEATQLVLQAGYYAGGGDIFVLNMGKPVKIIDLAKKLIRLSGYEPYKDIDIVEIGIRPGEKMYEELSLSTEKSSATKNNLIQKNHPMTVDKSKLDVQLYQLQALVANGAPSDSVRQALFKLINADYSRPQKMKPTTKRRETKKD